MVLRERQCTNAEPTIQAKPAPPATTAGVQDGSYGPICIQAPIKGPQLTGPGASSPIGQAANQFLAGIPLPSFANMSEGEIELDMTPIGAKCDIDCLFLDIYVPAAAVENPSLRLPVISWFYGGAYIFGGKDQFGDILPFYDGTGLIQESGGNVIFVASNYRVCSLSSTIRLMAYNIISLAHMGSSPVQQWSSKGYQIRASMINEPLFSGSKIISAL